MVVSLVTLERPFDFSDPIRAVPWVAIVLQLYNGARFLRLANRVTKIPTDLPNMLEDHD